MDRRPLAPSVPPASASEASGIVATPLDLRVVRGDRAALEALLRTHARAVFDLCFHVSGPADARDAAQDALERIVTSVHRFDPSKGSFRSWALAVTRNVCRDRLRRRGLERAAFDAGGDDPIDAAISPLPDPERLALARADSHTLAAALATLPEPMRAALVLFHVHEERYETIAATLEVPLGTVMTWLHRGRKRLRAALEVDATEATAAPVAQERVKS